MANPIPKNSRPDDTRHPVDDGEPNLPVDPDTLATPEDEIEPGETWPLEGQASSRHDDGSDDQWRDDTTGIDDQSAPPQPLDFDDGDESRPNGPHPVRQGGTWDDEGADSGRLKPPSELHSDRKG